MYKFVLENSSKKHTCPACGQKRFVRYVNIQNGQYLSSETGRCDRESSCGFHQTPKMYFKEISFVYENKPKGKKGRMVKQTKKYEKPTQLKYEARKLAPSIIKPDFIKTDYLLKSLTNYEQNNFVRFLFHLFPNNYEIVNQSIKKYFIGTSQNKTIFWQVDKSHRIRTGKIIAYNPKTGKRERNIYPNWIHAQLKRQGKLKQDFNLKQCFFGEHLLPKEQEKPIAIVEAEKTALIASICFSDFVWLSVGSKQSLKFERLKSLNIKQKIILYPDGDGFDEWNKQAVEARKQGLDISISKVINTLGTPNERKQGIDLADCLINEQLEINCQNKAIDEINKKIERVKTDRDLFNQFNRILDKQIANLTKQGFTKRQAKRHISKPENVRSVALGLV